jgi:hypothetical protein
MKGEGDEKYKGQQAKGDDCDSYFMPFTFNEHGMPNAMRCENYGTLFRDCTNDRWESRRGL